MSKNDSLKAPSKKESSDENKSKTSSNDSKKSTDSNTGTEKSKSTESKTGSEKSKSSESKTGIEKTKSTTLRSQSSKDDQTSKGMGGSLRMTSTDIRQLTKESQSADQSAGGLIPAGGAPPGESVYDTIAYIIKCPKHKKVAIFKADKDKITWLPFIASAPNKTWNDSSEDGLSIIFNKQDAELDAKLGTKVLTKEKRCLHVYRTQIPNKQRFISLIIYYIVLDKDKDKDKGNCCKDEKRIKWLPIQDVKNGNIENVWGPEPQDFTQDNVLSDKRARATGITEQSYDHIKELLPKEKGKPKNEEQQMISEAGIGETELDKLYDDYIEHCFPSLTMSFDSFKTYTSKYLDYDHNDTRYPLLFNAFNSKRNNCLNFHELVSGLGAMETKAAKCGPRLQFIFRYYNADCSGKMSLKEFRKMVKDCNVGSPDSSIDTKAKTVFDQLGAKESIDFETFKKGVDNQTIKGFSGICRAKILEQITKSTTTRIEKKSAIKKKAGFLMQNRRNKGKCLACRGKKFDYGLHAIKLDTNGRCVEPRRIIEPDSTTNTMTPQKYSIDYTFNTRSVAHTVKDLIRDFNRKKDIKGFLSNDTETLVSYLDVLVRDVGDFLSGENRLIKVNSPAFVFGDIDGNLEDLLQFEKLLYQSFPILSGHYIFLGNFTGKGDWGVECATYLFALKLIAPTKIILLRGSQEMRKKDKLLTDCIAKYGKENGQKVYDSLNNIFDKLPLCAIVDEKIFCSHSGVPTGVNNESKISSVVNDLKDPGGSTIANDIMNGQLKESEVNKFLNNLGLSHFIRSNPKEPGYKIEFKGKALTIYSSSSNNKEAVTAFIESDKIRIIRLDTSKGQKMEPKTDTVSLGQK